MSTTTQATSMTINARGMTGKPDNQRQPKTARACHNRFNPKGPVLENIFGQAVADPHRKRGIFTSAFCGRGLFRLRSLVYGRGWGYPQGRPHGLSRVFNILVRPMRLKTCEAGCKSRQGATQ